MSDAHRPDDANGVPPIDELERTAIPAAFRRAPRLGRILGTGIAFGVGLGLVLGFALPNSTGVGRGMVAVLLALGFGLLGGLTAGAIATRLDRATGAWTPPTVDPDGNATRLPAPPPATDREERD